MIQSFMHTSLLWTRSQRERTKYENSISKLFQLNLYRDWMNVQCAVLIVLTISAFTIYELILIRNFELFIMLESRWLYDSSTQRSLNSKSKGIIWIIFDCHHSMEMLPVEGDQYCAYHNAINVITNKSKSLFAPNIDHYERINC